MELSQIPFFRLFYCPSHSCHEDPTESGDGKQTINAQARFMVTGDTHPTPRFRVLLRCAVCCTVNFSPHVHGHLKRRLNAIKRCGLFSGWATEDLMRLARMSKVHRHASKRVLLMQRKVKWLHCKQGDRRAVDFFVFCFISILLPTFRTSRGHGGSFLLFPRPPGTRLPIYHAKGLAFCHCSSSFIDFYDFMLSPFGARRKFY